MTAQSQSTRSIWVRIAIWLVVICIIFAKPIAGLVQLALSDENASHTVLIPLIAAWLLYTERARIFIQPATDLTVGLVLALTGLAAACWAYSANGHVGAADALTLYMLGLVLLCLAGFGFEFGRQTLRRGAFPFAFLLLFVPLPSFLLDPVISRLQHGSADIAAAIFNVSGAPALREGLVFHLSRTSIEVAPECSGIRSSMALLVLALLVAHFAFRPFWKKAVFVAAGLLMMIIKNGVRIATLTLLANYVNPQFLYGNLHRQGGVVFFLLGLALLMPVYWLLKKGEQSAAVPAELPDLQPGREAL